MIRPEPAAPPAPARRPSSEAVPRPRPATREVPRSTAPDLGEEHTTIRPEPPRPPARPAPSAAPVGEIVEEESIPHEATIIRPAPAVPEPAPARRPTRGAVPAVRPEVAAEEPPAETAERTRIVDLPAESPVPPSRPRSRTGARPVRSSVGEPPPSSLDPALARRLRILVTGLAAFFTLFVSYVLLTQPGDTPSHAELELLYPYGFEGAYGPLGEVAPAAPDLDFEFVKLVGCPKVKATGSVEASGSETCLLYEYTGPNRFRGTMILKKVGSTWIRASDEGMPFRKAATRDVAEESGRR